MTARTRISLYIVIVEALKKGMGLSVDLSLLKLRNKIETEKLQHVFTYQFDGLQRDEGVISRFVLAVPPKFRNVNIFTQFHLVG